MNLKMLNLKRKRRIETLSKLFPKQNKLVNFENKLLILITLKCVNYLFTSLRLTLDYNNY